MVVGQRVMGRLILADIAVAYLSEAVSIWKWR